MLLVVGVADMKVSKNKDDVIITHALGSCVGITIYDPVNYVGGMLHYMLPNFSPYSSKNLLMYADSGIPILLKKYQQMGGKLSRAVIKAAGGAAIIASRNQDQKNSKRKSVLKAFGGDIEARFHQKQSKMTKNPVLKALGGRGILEDMEGANHNNGEETYQRQTAFDIGNKNIAILGQIIVGEYNLVLDNTDCGGDFYRTMKLFMTDGKVVCRNHLIGEWEL